MNELECSFQETEIPGPSNLFGEPLLNVREDEEDVSAILAALMGS